MRVLAWGTYDTGKPRTRILLRGLREHGIDVRECHSDVWGEVEDKSSVESWGRRLGLLWRWLRSYSSLLLRLRREPRPDVILVGYLGQVDVLVLWPFARLRGVPVVWDVFLVLHDTVVDDRRLFDGRHPLARLLYAWEWLACRACDRMLMDTSAHADHLAAHFGLPRQRVGVVPVGAETEVFRPAPAGRGRSTSEPLEVLFYGQFIPLHGVETIVAAARLAEKEDIHWTLIGQGQEAPKIERLLAREPRPRVTRISWVEYSELPEFIQRADVCLGIFGESGKASRVVPNKVHQILAMGRPLVTRDSPAMRELIPEPTARIRLVPPADAAALLQAVRDLGAAARADAFEPAAHAVTPATVGARLLEELRAVVPGAANV